MLIILIYIVGSAHVYVYYIQIARVLKKQHYFILSLENAMFKLSKEGRQASRDKYLKSTVNMNTRWSSWHEPWNISDFRVPSVCQQGIWYGNLL